MNWIKRIFGIKQTEEKTGTQLAIKQKEHYSNNSSSGSDSWFYSGAESDSDTHSNTDSSDSGDSGDSGGDGGGGGD
jgi:hypothetical protein